MRVRELWVNSTTFTVMAALLAALTAAACGRDFFREYEYEEEMYVALDGSATLYVHSSIPALNALRGASFDENPAVPIDRDAIRSYFTTPATRVTRVTTSRRSNRRFAHVEIEVDDMRRLGGAPPLAWSSYAFGREGERYVFRQKVGPAVNKATGANWTGEELVAFRLHIPSKVSYHNAGESNLKRGNILVWEQLLSERLRGVPLEIDARMETESILYRALWLFAATVAAVIVTFGVVIWLVVRRGKKPAPRTTYVA